MNLIKLKKLANSRQFTELEVLWSEALDEPEAEVEEMLRVAAQVRRLGEEERADAMLQGLLHAHEQRHDRHARLDVARQAAVLLPASTLLRRELRQLMPAFHTDYEHAGTLTSRLLAEGIALPDGLAVLDRFLQLRPGSFLSDRSHLEPGMVEEVDAEHTRLTVSFSGRRETLERARVGEVIVLPPDHFPSLLLYRPDELRRLAADDPEAFVVKALTSTRDRTLAHRELRTHYVALHGEDGWSGWWKKARLVLKTSTRIEMTGSGQPTFHLLRQERSYEDRVREQLRGLTEPAPRLQFILERLGEARRDKSVSREMIGELGNAAARLAAPLLEKDAALTLACLALHAEAAELGGDVAEVNPRAAAQVIARIHEPAILPSHLGDRLLQLVLAFVRRVLPAEQWTVFWGRVLPRTGRMTADMMARELLAAGQERVLVSALEDVLSHPTASPEVLGWLWRTRFADTKTGQSLAAMQGMGVGRLMNALLDLMDATGRMTALSDDKRLRKVLEQGQEGLELHDGEPIRVYLSATGPEEARGLKERIERNGGIRASTRTSLLGWLRTAHPEVFAEMSRPWEEDVYYTTMSGLQHRQAALDELVQVDLPAVARQIGEAASHGDLSENAEYTAALEKRDQITSRATRLEGELARAKIITDEMVRSAFVNVGTRVRVRDLVTNVEETYSFLGVWDSQPEVGILSYRAPLAMAFMGARPGDQVEYGEEGERRHWEVLEVGPAL
ncbi:MAG: GreA/GreB family elongation factor [bacterium]|nr:GreA/GreB family elongation factor [bacterium]